MIEVIIPFKTPSTNSLYATFRGRRIKSKEARDKGTLVQEICQGIKHDLYGKKLRVTIEVYENWLTKKETIKKKDVENRSKFLVDSVFTGLLLEDSFIYDHNIKKIQSDIEQSIIRIWVLEDGTYN